jgi:4-carboxymuconolactone decarboxylase
MISRKQRVPFADTSKLPADFDLERYKVNGKVVNIFGVLINHPKLLRAWGRFGAYILSNEQTLSAREREIAILRIGWLNQAQYEWEQHVRIGKASGLSDDDIDRITKGPRAGWNRQEAALLQAAGRDVEDAFGTLQHPADDGPCVYHRPVQSGVVGFEQPGRPAR